MSEMSREEQRLMQSISVAEGIHDLRAYEKEALAQLRGAFSYLADKYPGIDIRYRLFDPLTKLTEHGILICTAGDDSELSRCIIRRRNGKYTYTDTLYGELVRQEYDSSLQELLEKIIGPVKAYTSFYTPAGKELGMYASAADLCGFTPALTRHTDLFMTGEFHGPETILETLRRERFFASYSVYGRVHGDLYARNCFEQIRDEYACLNFNLFETGGESGI